ncbi:hypothetical protein [Streptomyces sp. NPDC003247]|uniref:hypothetical protein n=1 Tax=Streptomyces sp. NPDC003247 TaxID=3364677 RepID=UPI00369387B0
MRRALVHVLAWTLATGAATTLSWWGVHTVMAGTAYDPPRAVPLAAGDTAARESEPPTPVPTSAPVSASPEGRPASSASPSPSPSPEPSRTSRSPAPADPSSTAAASPTPTGRVRSYDTDGGRVVFELQAASATLVSATPDAGWSMQVWKTETWIRVEFTSGADHVSVFCTWHDGPPRVEVGTY